MLREGGRRSQEAREGIEPVEGEREGEGSREERSQVEGDRALV